MKFTDKQIVFLFFACFFAGLAAAALAPSPAPYNPGGIFAGPALAAEVYGDTEK